MTEMPGRYMGEGEGEERGTEMPGRYMGEGEGEERGTEMPGRYMGEGEAEARGTEMPGRYMGEGATGTPESTGEPGSDKSTTDDEMPNTRNCGTMDVHRQLMTEDPSYAEARAEIENLALQYEKGIETAERPGITCIPVVVHVVWNTAVQNISDTQVVSQIDILNRDFRRTNPDVANTPAAFLPLASDARIEFLLANT